MGCVRDVRERVAGERRKHLAERWAPWQMAERWAVWRMAGRRLAPWQPRGRCEWRWEMARAWGMGRRRMQVQARMRASRMWASQIWARGVGHRGWRGARRR